MKVFGLLFLFVLVVFLASPVLVFSQETDTDLEDNQAQLLAVLGEAEASADDNLIDLQVAVVNPLAGAASGYQIQFAVTQEVFELIKNGGLKFAFPAGFDLTQIMTITISDDYLPLELAVDRFSVSDQLLTIHLQQLHQDDLIVGDGDYVNVTLLIDYIVNPSQAGIYQLAAVAFKQNNAVVAGPTFSAPFNIVASTVVSITVTPGDDISLQAGDMRGFSAEGFDEFGNKVPGLVFSWTLDCGECIGYFVDSTLHATTTGQARAVAHLGQVAGESGLITVMPGDLAVMNLTLSDTQFVGYPLRGTGSIALYDAFENPKTDYILSQEPISMAPSGGLFTPDLLGDDVLFSNGVVDVLAAEIVYEGLSGTVDVRAESGSVVSNYVPVSFNGYDILEVLDEQQQPLTVIYAEQRNSGYVVIRPDGNVAPLTATIAVALESNGEFWEYPVEDFLLGRTDTVVLDMRQLTPVEGEDIVIVILNAVYEFEGSQLTLSDTVEVPVTVLPPVYFSVIEGSVSPDSAVPGYTIPFSFDMVSTNFNGTVDSAEVFIELYYPTGSSTFELFLLFNGIDVPFDNGDGTYSFTDLPGLLSESLDIEDGLYALTIKGQVYSGGSDFVLRSFFPDSLYVFTPGGLSVDPSSVSPVTVSAGSIALFRFNLTSDSEVPLGFVADQSSFTISGSGFSTTTSLNVSGGAINPGDNEVNTEGVFIPQSQLGNELSINATVAYSVPGIAGTLLFTTDFGQMVIPVTALPTVQIVSVDAVTPNIPNVNTGQSLQISAVVANMGSTPVGSMNLRLSSDGASTFDPVITDIELGANETIEVLWDVVAADVPNLAEIFVVDVEQSGILVLPPVDNVTLITIQTPADLELTYSQFGSENGMIDYGHELILTVELVNSGMAGVTDAQYMLVTEGFDFDGPDTLSGGISVGRHIDFGFISPQRDTTINLAFFLTSIPVDANTGQRAIIGDTSFALSIRVISAEASLFVETEPVGTNLVLPDRQKDLVQLVLTNTGISSVARMRLDRIVIQVKDAANNPLTAMSVFDIGGTGFYEQDQRVSVLTAGDDLLVFAFDQFFIDPRQSRSLVLKAELKQTAQTAVVLYMGEDGIQAQFTEPPNAGLAPAIRSDVPEGEPLLAQALAIKAANLSGSFLVETNPFNPEDPAVSPLHLSYELPQSASVEFRILTLTGEEVYSRDFEAGVNGGLAGENIIEWDGCNDKGHVVLNGVYVAIIHNVDTGESARLKIAVVK